MMKKPWKTILLWVLAALAVGTLAGLLSRSSMKIFESSAQQPLLSPPMWLFPVVWVLLYAMMGVSAGRIYNSKASKERTRGLNLFIAQLIVNFFWPPIFFNAMAFGFAAIWLVLLWGLVLWNGITT